MISFPSTEGLAKSDISGDLIYGGSVAINLILNRLKETSGVGQQNTLFLINTLTIADNVFDKTLSDKAITEAFTHDVDLLNLYIEAYSYGFKDRKAPVIVLYSPEYTAVPKQYARDNSANNNGRVLDFHRRIMTHFPKTPSFLKKTQDSVKCFVPCGGTAVLPHMELFDWLRQYGKDIGYGFNVDDVVLISHCLVDNHIGARLKNVKLLERYTGIFKTYETLSTKLEKSGVVPFNPYTHRLLGDDVLFASMVQGKRKKELIELAATERWVVQSDQTILRRLAALLNVPSETFVKPRMI